MKVLVFGGTGYIGSTLIDDLKKSGHEILGLARSDSAEIALLQKGVRVVRGNIRTPQNWSHVVQGVDAIIHTAATFTDDMGDVDRNLVAELVTASQKRSRPLRFIYTGGSWLYGDTAGIIATENTPYNAISAFNWMVENAKIILNASCFDGIILHPAIVWDRDGGGFLRFISSIQEKGHIEVWGALETHWPLVHREDLAAAYTIALEHGIAGESYNLCAEEGVLVEDIVQKIAIRFEIKSAPVIRTPAEVIAEQGDWAEGPMLNQRMSAEKFKTAFNWKPRHDDALSQLS